MVFCTLFDINYIDKGLVMYRSLVKYTSDIRMYILAMDEKCEEILRAYNYTKIIVINIDKFSSCMGLCEIRKTRKHSEFCWTCTSHLIDYVLSVYGEKECTYVDADLRFYANPQCLLNEMNDKNVLIVEHRFDNSSIGKISRATSGTYCVQFNTFRNEKGSLELLRWWEKMCYESCSNTSMKNSGVFGDQGYLETWGSYKNVHVLKNLGGGVAPWNAYQYVYVIDDVEKDCIKLKDKKTKKKFELIFFHFHNIKYYSPRKVNICAFEYGDVDQRIVERIYIPYLLELEAVKEELKSRFGLYPILYSHPGIAENNESKSIKEYLKSVDKYFFSRIYLKTVGKLIRNLRIGKNVVEF